MRSLLPVSEYSSTTINAESGDSKQAILMSTKYSPRFRKFLLRLILTFTVLAGLWFTVSSSLFLGGVGVVLSANDQPSKNADAVVVLMGDASSRPLFAAKLVLEKFAPRLVYVKSDISAYESAGLISPEWELVERLALKAGLDPAALDFVKDQGRITSTIEEAQALRRHFKAKSPPVERVILVTSWYHSHRAQWIFEKVFEGSAIKLEMKPVEGSAFNAGNWWQSEDGLITVFAEYIKWLRYLALYAGRSFEEV